MKLYNIKQGWIILVSLVLHEFILIASPESIKTVLEGLREPTKQKFSNDFPGQIMTCDLAVMLGNP